LKFEFPFHVDDHDEVDLRSKLEILIARDPDLFVILTNRRNTPLIMESMGELIYSFSCGYKYLKELILQFNIQSVYPEKFLFILLDYIFTGRPSLKKVIVKQLPIAEIAHSPGQIAISLFLIKEIIIS
jgi:hypothetical protein